MRTPRVAVAFCGAAVLCASFAHAESGPVNIHIEPAAAFALAARENPGTGQAAALKLDVTIFGPFALQAQGSLVNFSRTSFLGVNQLLGGGGGIRIRVLDDKKGYLLHYGEDVGRHEGNLWGNLWIDGSVQALGGGPTTALGWDVGLGAEASLVDGLQLGPFIKYARADTASMILAGVSVSVSVVDTSVHDKDPDKDGIVDPDDKCPDNPEDKDGFEDEDGCPEADNDQDGITDLRDRCPNDPEDKDGFQDQDGCPEPDNDKDGLADPQDKCPLQPEDKDGFEDEDGCPDPDNDKDGIADEKDKCPLEPETYNGREDEDGCPEKEAKVFVTEKQIVITDRIFFEFNKHRILPKSYPILQNVADVMKRFPGIKKLRIDGHTDDVGTPEVNQKLSERRAEEVKKFLVKNGVEADRLEFKGFGKSQPLEEGSTEAAREKNRRVEFVIVDPAGGVLPVVEQPPAVPEGAAPVEEGTPTAPPEGQAPPPAPSPEAGDTQPPTTP